MPIVLASPPSIADPDEQVRQHEADPVVPFAGLEHLTVRRVVPEEGDLRHQHGEHDRRNELPPAVTDPDECSDPGGKGNYRPDELGPVIAVAAAHQTHVVDAARSEEHTSESH